MYFATYGRSLLYAILFFPTVALSLRLADGVITGV